MNNLNRTIRIAVLCILVVGVAWLLIGNTLTNTTSDDTNNSQEKKIGKYSVQSLDAFARLDSKAAAAVVRQDELVDNEFRSILRQLITFMMEDPRTIKRSLEILFVAKALERIGDHSKNIAEFIIYVVKGADVRHIALADVESAVK